MTRGNQSAEHGSDFTAAEAGKDGERMVEFTGVARQGTINGIGLAGEAGIVNAGATTDPVGAAATIERSIDGGSDGRIADPHFAQADEIRFARHRFHTVGDGGRAHLVVERSLLGDVAGGQFQRQLEHSEIDFMQSADLRNGGATIGEVGDHLSCHFARKGRDPLIGDAVIAGENGDHGVVETGARPVLPAGQKLDQLFHAAERAGRLGQLHFAGPYGRYGGIVAIGHGGQQFDDIGKSGIEGGHGRSSTI